jgi:hypothetical protein
MDSQGGQLAVQVLLSLWEERLHLNMLRFGSKIPFPRKTEGWDGRASWKQVFLLPRSNWEEKVMERWNGAG